LTHASLLPALLYQMVNLAPSAHTRYFTPDIL
jgi:hypothetical protein